MSLPREVDPGFAVILSTYGAFDVKEVAAALALELRQPRVDVAMRLRRNPGLPFEGLEQEQAQRIVEIMGGLGIVCAAIPGVPPQMRPVRVEGAAIESEGLELRLPGGALVMVGWAADESELLSAVVLVREQASLAARDEVEPGDDQGDDVITQLAATYKRSQAGNDWHSAARERVRSYLQQDAGVPTVRLEMHADIALVTGELYRISSEAFEFRCLGDAVESSTLANMGRLVRRLDGEFSASAARSDGWLALAAGDLAGAAFTSLDAYEGWLRWRLTREELGRGSPGSDDEPGLRPRSPR